VNGNIAILGNMKKELEYKNKSFIFSEYCVIFTFAIKIVLVIIKLKKL
jgi:hypothetical protein